MQRIISRIEIEHQHLRILRQRAHPHPQQCLANGLWPRQNLAVTIRELGAQFEPVQGGRAGQREASIFLLAMLPKRIEFASRYGQQWIAPQLRVIIEIFVSQRQGLDALGEQFLHSMLDQVRIATILEALGKRATEPQAAVDLAQEQRAGVAAQLSSAKIGDHFSRPKVLKKHRSGETLCLTGVGW